MFSQTKSLASYFYTLLKLEANLRCRGHCCLCHSLLICCKFCFFICARLFFISVFLITLLLFLYCSNRVEWCYVMTQYVCMSLTKSHQEQTAQKHHFSQLWIMLSIGAYQFLARSSMFLTIIFTVEISFFLQLLQNSWTQKIILVFICNSTRDIRSSNFRQVTDILVKL